MNVLPRIFQFGSGGTSGTSGVPSPLNGYIDDSPPIYTVVPEPVVETTSKSSFLSKLYNNTYEDPAPLEGDVCVAAHFITEDDSTSSTSQSFLSTLTGAGCCGDSAFSNSPVICAASPCPITFNAICVF